MCKEGIRIGRRTQTRRTRIAVQTTSTQMLKADANRISIIFPIPATNNIWIMPTDVAADGTGIKLYATGHTERFWIEQHGQFVTGAWNGISPAGAQTVDVLETLWVEE